MSLKVDVSWVIIFLTVLTTPFAYVLGYRLIPASLMFLIGFGGALVIEK